MTCERALVTYQTRAGKSYRIWFDALETDSSNYISCVTNHTHVSGTYTCISEAYSGRVLNCLEFRYFWISWEGGASLRIGKGKVIGMDTMINSNHAQFTPVEENSFKFGKENTRNVTSVWRVDKITQNPGQLPMC
jgi:hypothetical protein